MQQPGDPGGGEPGQGDRQDEAEDQHLRMSPRRPSDGEDIVQRHGKIGDQDLDQGAQQRLGLLRGRSVDARQGGFAPGFLGPAPGDQIAPHLPAHPEQQQAAGQEQADDLQQLHRDQGEAAQHDHRRAEPQDDRPALEPMGQARRRQADGDGVVPRQGEVDHHHLREGRQRGAPVGEQRPGQRSRPGAATALLVS